MRRENRVNLIFLVAFIIVALPGAVILFRKKLDPTAHRLDQPDPILNRLPYMAPLPAPPGVKWIVPDKTQEWVRSLTAPAPTLSALPPGPQWEPVISEDHALQVLAISAIDHGSRLTILVWKEAPDGSSSKFNVRIDADSGVARVAEISTVTLPPKVRHELVMAGYVRPPKLIPLLRVDVPELASSSQHRLELSAAGGGIDEHHTVEFKVPPMENSGTAK